MPTTPIKLSATGRAMVTLAATREDRLVRPPQLPTAAARQVVRSLLNNGLVAEVTAPQEEPRTMIQDSHANGRSAALTAGDILAWLEEREGEEARAAEADDAVKLTGPMGDTAADVAVAAAPAAVARAPETPPVAPMRANLRQAAQAVLDAWNDEASRQTDMSGALAGPMAGLQATLAGPSLRAVTGAPRKPREGTKQEHVLALLRRPEGASGPAIAETTGWASHTVRGFLAGLKKKGVQVETLERVRQVGPNKQGAKGSYTVYRIGEAG